MNSFVNLSEYEKIGPESCEIEPKMASLFMQKFKK